MSAISTPVLFGFGLGFQEFMIVAIVAVLLFGRRLPEVARSLGQSYREFRKGLFEIQSQIDFSDAYHTAGCQETAKSSASSSKAASYDDYDDYESASAPKFEPPPAAPQPVAEEGSGADSAQDSGPLKTPSPASDDASVDASRST